MIIDRIDAFMVMMDIIEMWNIMKGRIGISILRQVNIAEVAIRKPMDKFLLLCIQNESIYIIIYICIYKVIYIF